MLCNEQQGLSRGHETPGPRDQGLAIQPNETPAPATSKIFPLGVAFWNRDQRKGFIGAVQEILLSSFLQKY